MTAKKAPRKKTPPTPALPVEVVEECSNCFFYRLFQRGNVLYCHLDPRSARTAPMHWCGGWREKN